MQIGMIERATRILGKSQGYMGLPVRDTDLGPEGNCMVSAWHPTPKEIAAINAGAPIHIYVLGTAHPPMMVGVGESPE
jgi:hypothetical protein